MTRTLRAGLTLPCLLALVACGTTPTPRLPPPPAALAALATPTQSAHPLPSEVLRAAPESTGEDLVLSALACEVALEGANGDKARMPKLCPAAPEPCSRWDRWLGRCQ